MEPDKADIKNKGFNPIGTPVRPSAVLRAMGSMSPLARLGGGGGEDVGLLMKHQARTRVHAHIRTHTPARTHTPQSVVWFGPRPATRSASRLIGE